MKTFFVRAALILTVLFIAVISCKKNAVPKCDGTASTYNSNMQALINSKCTNPGCHPNYATFAGIKSVLDNGAFKNRVVSTKDMPQGGSLGTSDLNKVQCWIDAGYPEK